MKRGVILCILLLAGFVQQLIAETFGSYGYTVNGNEVTITKFLCDTPEAIVPAAIGGMPVSLIGASAFMGCTSLESVAIPESVTSIGDYAFGECINLTSVSIPDTLTSLGHHAFFNCNSLISVTIPEGITTIGATTFSGCSNLTNITIPDSVTSIGDFAFNDCTSLTSIHLGNGVTVIGQGAFGGCTGLTNLDLPNSVLSIDNWAFERCNNLTTVNIPKSVKTIGSDVFGQCASLTDFTVDPNNTAYSSLDGVLFNKNRTIIVEFPTSRKGEYTIPDSITTIEELTFAFSNGLTSINIPDGVTTIGVMAFGYCTNLTSVTIAESVSSLGDVAFVECSSLMSIYFMGEQPALGSGVFQATHPELVIYYPEAITGWGETFGGIPTAPFSPWGKYVPITSDEGTHADTYNWLGIVEVSLDPWIWCEMVPCWFNIPDQTAAAGHGWVYPPDQDSLLIVEIPGTPWGYSFALHKWLHLTASSWAYMM